MQRCRLDTAGKRNYREIRLVQRPTRLLYTANLLYLLYLIQLLKEIPNDKQRNQLDFYILQTSALLYLLWRDRGANGEVAPSLKHLFNLEGQVPKKEKDKTKTKRNQGANSEEAPFLKNWPEFNHVCNVGFKLYSLCHLPGMGTFCANCLSKFCGNFVSIL